MTRQHSLINDYLTLLGVPHTSDYSDRRFDSMPFKTLFGFARLLAEYGVPSEGYLLNDKEEIHALTPPFLASTSVGVVIVTGIERDEDSSGEKDIISYVSQGVPEKVSAELFFKAWNGKVLLSYPEPDAREPEYRKHARLDFFMRMKKWVLLFCAVALYAYLFVANGIYSHISTILLSLFDIGGLYFTWLLVQKSLNIHTKAADRVCKVIQEGGCDDILSLSASKFFGLFGWSEVGFAYFSVSLLTLMLLPAMLPWLALCNLCCLPFTFWSIWYQKFRARKWCTLCVCVQGTLWLLFFCYLFGGWLDMAWPLSPNFFALGVAYLGVMLSINALEYHYGKTQTSAPADTTTRS